MVAGRAVDGRLTAAAAGPGRSRDRGVSWIRAAGGPVRPGLSTRRRQRGCLTAGPCSCRRTARVAGSACTRSTSASGTRRPPPRPSTLRCRCPVARCRPMSRRTAGGWSTSVRPPRAADLYVAPTDRRAWSEADVSRRGETDHRFRPGHRRSRCGRGERSSYSPWSTVLPRWWYPTFGRRRRPGEARRRRDGLRRAGLPPIRCDRDVVGGPWAVCEL